MNIITNITSATKVLFYGTVLFGFAGAMHLCQLTSFVIAPFSERIVFDINSKVCGTVWGFMQWIFERRKKARITYSGDRIPKKESAMVISNHRSWTDFYLLHSIAIRRGMLSNCKYFIKDSLKWIPFFGWGMWLAGFIFVRRTWMRDQHRVNATFAKVDRLKAPIWVMSFVEGSRLNAEKLRAAQEFSAQRDLPVMQNVMVPRVKGFVACMSKLRKSHVKYLYDFTVAYRHGGTKAGFGVAPNMIQIHVLSQLSPEYEFHVNVKRYAMEDLPSDEKELTHWLRERFMEKDAFLENMKENWVDGLDEEIWTEDW